MTDYSDDDRETVAQAIKGYLDKNRMSRAALADLMKVGKSTIDKACIGEFTDRFVHRFTAVTGVDPIGGTDRTTEAPEEYGGYRIYDLSDYFSKYLFFRYSFENPADIVSYNAAISWDNRHGGAQLSVSSRDGENRIGYIHLPKYSSHIFVASNYRGWISNMIVSQIDIHGFMRGLMLACGNIFGSSYTPICTPVVMKKVEVHHLQQEPFIKLTPDAKGYGQAKELLDSVKTQQYARVI